MVTPAAWVFEQVMQGVTLHTKSGTEPTVHRFVLMSFAATLCMNFLATHCCYQFPPQLGVV